MNLLIFNLKTDADDCVLGFTTDWINALASRCNRVIVITMMAGRMAIARNVTVYSVGKEKGFSEPRRLLEFYRLLVSVLRQEKIDACFAHMMPIFAVLGWPLLKLRRIPIVLWYTHSHVPYFLHIATVLVDRVVSASPGGFRISTDKVSFIGHGIDVNRFPLRQPKSAPPNKTVLLTVGRISPVKRLEIPLQAISLLPEHLKSQIIFRSIGDPLGHQGLRYSEELRRLVQTLDIENIVDFEAALPFHQVKEAYQSADIFINTSASGGLDKALLEAMSTGLPIITCNPSMQTVLDAELAGQWFIPSGDPKVIAERLQTLLGMSQEDKWELGQKLRHIVITSHSIEGLSERILNEFARIPLRNEVT